jgi:hypothetical protein
MCYSIGGAGVVVMMENSAGFTAAGGDNVRNFTCCIDILGLCNRKS